jgi:predicted nuclease of predicted toxin-antitoxin system
VEALRGDGHDVTWIRTEAPGIADSEVLRRAVAEDRILITFDKDFGDLAFRNGLSSACGIVLFRLRAGSSAELAAAVRAAIASRSDWAGQFSVVEPGRIRMRPVPRSPPT